MPTREQKRSDSQRWEIENGDRSELMSEASRLVWVLTEMRRPAADASLHRGTAEPTQAELRAYEAALRLLAREFDRGPSATGSHLVESSVEMESSTDTDGDIASYDEAEEAPSL